MAEEVLNRAIREGILEKRRCVTSKLKLSISENTTSGNRLRIYGDQSVEIEQIISENPEMGKPLHEQFPYTKAEIIWICRNEMPNTLEDVLARRTRSLFLNARASLEIALAVAKIMADELGFGEKWQQEQIKVYNQLVVNYL
jgi:glycerol-3-phosphate dehydrogenase